MDTNNPPQTNNNHSHRLVFSLIGLLILVVAVGVVYFWKQQEVDSLTAQLAASSTAANNQKEQTADREKALASLPNKVDDVSKSPVDLIAFLAADNTQCYKQQRGGYYKIVAHTNDQFAKMQYGCIASGSTTPSGTTTYILAKKVNDKWQLISPTDQWVAISASESMPSCKMVNDNKVSKLVTPQCFVGEAKNNPTVNPTLQQVTNP